MRNFLLCSIIGTLLLIAIIIGAVREGASRDPVRVAATVPHIGSVEVLNGCGQGGAANKVADFLREKNFDVKSIGNAETWNYPFTMVISRTPDMSIAHEIANALNTDKVVLVRTTEQIYDVTVVLGPDYGERIP